MSNFMNKNETIIFLGNLCTAYPGYSRVANWRCHRTNKHLDVRVLEQLVKEGYLHKLTSDERSMYVSPEYYIA